MRNNRPQFNIKLKFSLKFFFFSGLFFFGVHSVIFGQSQTYTSGSGTFTVPKGVTSLNVTVRGAGGGGAGGNGTNGGGAGGGVTILTNFAVSPDSLIPYTVGVAGSGGTTFPNDATDGGYSAFGKSTIDTLTANGGTKGSESAGGIGGNATGGASNFSGGNGFYSVSIGGGGGSSAGTTENGNDGSSSTGGIAPNGGFAGGDGAPTNSSLGSDGVGLGAGGGGGYNNNGGNGKPGQIDISWTCPSVISISYSSASFCKSSTSELPSISGTAGGSFSSTVGISLDSQTGEINASTSTAGTYTITYGFDAESGYTVNCPESKTTFEVTINALPTISGTLNVCIGATTVLSGSGTPAVSNPWQSLSTDSATVDNSGTVTGIAKGTSKIVYTDINGCRDTVTVLVNALPTPVLSSNSPVCQGDTVRLSSDSQSSYVWTGPNAFSSGLQNPKHKNDVASYSHVYNLTVSDANSCSATASITVEVVPSGRIYVNDNATGTNDGTSWSNAFTDLQIALDSANSSICNVDTIWVAGGIYKPSKDPSGNTSPSDARDRTFYLREGINLIGGFAGTENLLSQRTASVIAANPSLLSGDANSTFNTNDDSYHVVLSVNDNNSTIVDGFTISKGNANGIGTITVESEAISKNSGGGFYNNGSDLIIRNSTFTENNANSGASIFNQNSSPTIDNCNISNNSAIYGAGIFNNTSSPNIQNSNFSSNTALEGGAIKNFESSPNVANCSFSANAASSGGGGIYNQSNSSPSIEDCSFSSNSASIYGGGIYNTATSSPFVKKCTFSSNQAYYGGGMASDGSIQTIDSCNFFANIATGDGGGLYIKSTTSSNVKHCIFENNNSNAGGGLFTSSAPISIDSCSFTNNVSKNGGALGNSSSSPTISHSSFISNTGSSFGGAIYNTSSSAPNILNNLFSANDSPFGGGFYNRNSSPKIRFNTFSANTATNGGGIANSTSSPEINNNLFLNNNGTESGGAMYNASSSAPEIVNCTFYNNTSLLGGGIYNVSLANASLKNNIFWLNKKNSNSNVKGADIENSIDAKQNVTYSALQLTNNLSNYPNDTVSGFQGNRNTNLYGKDPLFVNAADPNGTDNIFGNLDDGLNLTNCSPAINIGDTANVGLLDLKQEARVINDQIDMGAYENGATQAVSLTASQNSVFCYGTNVIFNATPTVGGGSPTYDFRINDVSVQNNTSSTYSSATLNNGDIVKVFFRSSPYSCANSGSSKSLEMKVNPLPIPVVSADPPICEGNTIKIYAANDNTPDLNTYSWTGPGIAGTSTLDTTIFAAALSTISGVYSVTVTDSNSCSATASTSITVYPLPTSVVTGGGTVCANVTRPNVTLTFTGSSPWTVSYTDGTTAVTDSVISTSTFQILEATPGTYTVTAIKDANECDGVSMTGSATVIVNAIPAAPSVTQTSSSVVCEPEKLTFNASGCDVSGTVTWSNTSTGTTLELAAVNTYTVSATCTENSCVSPASSNITGLEIKAKPAAPTVSIDAPGTSVVCSPDQIALSATECAGTVSWSHDSTGTSLTFNEVGIYSFKAVCTIDGCTSDSSNAVAFEIKAKPAPPTVIQPANLVVCAPNTLNLSASGCVGGTITWNDPLTTTGDNLVLSALGSYNISATCTIAGCESEPSTPVLMEINSKPAKPEITLLTAATVCFPDSIKLSASCATGNLIWSNDSTGNNLSVSQIGNYTLSANCSLNGCLSDDSTVVPLTVNALPLATASNDSPVCDGTQVNLSSSGGLTYSWTGPGGFNENGSSQLINNPSVGTYTVMVTASTTCSTTATTEVTIKPIPAVPTISTPTNSVVCFPQTIVLNSSGCSGTVSWLDTTSGSSQIIHTGSSLTISAVGKYYVSAICTENSCPSDTSAILPYEVKAKPIVQAGSNSPICTGTTLSLTGVGTGTFSWSGPGFNSTEQNPSVLSPLNGTYILTLTGSNSCTASATTSVIVKPKPSAPSISVPGGTVLTCAPGTLSFIGNCSTGNLTWTEFPAGATIIPNSSSNSTIRVSNVSVYDISATCTFNDCVSNTATKSVVSKPAAPIITDPAELSVCFPGTLTITGDCNGNDIKWSNDSTKTSFTLTAVNTYSLSAHCAVGSCTSTESPVSQLEIKALPAAPIVVVPEVKTVCSPNTISISASCSGGATVKWSNAATGNTLVLSGVGIYNISASCILNDCESESSASTTYAINALPVASLTSNSPVCAGSTLNINASGGNTYSWQVPNSAPSIANQNLSFPNVTISKSGTYTATVTATNLCAVTATIAVTVNASPTVSISANPDTLLSGESSTLTLSGCNAGSINWSVINSSSNPVVVALGNTTTFTAACNLSGCTGVASKTVVVTNPPCPSTLTLTNPIDDYNTGIITKTASSIDGKITANNKITGDARVELNAKSMELEPGFVAEQGTVFIAEVGGCN